MKFGIFRICARSPLSAIASRADSVGGFVSVDLLTPAAEFGPFDPCAHFPRVEMRRFAT